MAVPSESDRPLSAWTVVQPNYQGNARYAKVSGTAVFKQIRLDNGRRLFIELVNELVCNALAYHLDIPVVPTLAGDLPNLGPGLLSVVLGEEDFQPANAEQHRTISNLHCLKPLFVFDQWVFNTDRQARHIKIGTDPGRPGAKVLYAYDHGHTLNDYNGKKWTLSTFSDAVAKSVAQTYFDSGLGGVEDVSGTVARIQRVSEKQVEWVVESSRLSLDRFAPTEDERSDLDVAIPVVKRILIARRDYLPEIVRTWCKQNGKAP